MTKRTKTYFIADLHLGATYIADEHAEERIVARFLQSIAADAAHIYLLGDVLDYWYEYRTVAPRGYLRFFGALTDLADSGVKIHWMIGNHDIWLFDYLRHEIGMDVIDGSKVVEIQGSKFFLNHGDGVGKLPVGFKIIRRIFRNRFCQVLYSAIHPRWTIGFAHNWSQSSRKSHSLRDKPYDADADPLLAFSRKYLAEVDSTINYFVFGHRHKLVEKRLSDTSEMVILGDWLTTKCYAVFDGKKLDIKHFDNHYI